MKLKTVSVDLSSLRDLLEGEERAYLAEHVIDRHQQIIVATNISAPLLACYDGTEYVVFDGYHRLEAMRRIGFNTCRVTIYKGDRRDAYRRYVRDKLRALEPLPKLPLFRHCLRCLKKDSEWSAMDTKQLSCLFGRKPVFFENLKMWDPESRGSQIVFIKTKHGTTTLTKRYRS